MLIKGIREKGWTSMNSGIEGDEEEDVYEGKSVMDYILGEEEVRDKRFRDKR